MVPSSQTEGIIVTDSTIDPQIDAEAQRQIELLQRGTTQLVSEAELKSRIVKSLQDDRPLRIKLGVDPTAHELHLGFTLPLSKLRLFQDLGHKAVLIVGDATAMVGDPSGKSKLRPVLTREQVAQNLLTYTTQASLVLDLERTEIVQNASWFDGMGFEGILQLTTRMTVAQMIERDTFQ